MEASAVFARTRAIKLGRALQYLTIAWNSAECLVALAAGFVAGSIALVGFGFDSAVEVTSSLAALWRLRNDADEGGREAAERRTLRIIGLCFLLLAAYVLGDAAIVLVAGLGLNAGLGWWWSDPVAGLVMVPLIANEGWQALKGRTCCAD